MTERKHPGAHGGASGAEMPSCARAGNSKVAHGAGRAKPSGAYRITPESGGESFLIFVKGREAWALQRLADAGKRGCTPIEQPAPRWSAYVHRLRGHGVPIETIHENHGGAFAGTHARYVLRAAAVREGGAA